MKKIAIIGAGPTGIYTFFSLLKHAEPLSVTVYEKGAEAGVGMPYSDEENSRMMLANIASIEIPPLFSTYIDWLRQLSDAHLARYGVARDSLHVRQFLPRILLGEYFRDQFLQLVERARQQGFTVAVHESCQVTDLEVTPDGVRLWAQEDLAPEIFDLAVIATGHVWPDEESTTQAYFPSPWSGLMEASIPACRVGIMGTSLSGIDAAMAIAAQHGVFTEQPDEHIRFERRAGSERLSLTLMSRSGILPEADFYCPIPYEPLTVVTEEAMEKEMEAGAEGLLDRIFALMVEELAQADPRWCERINLRSLTPDTFRDAWFADRERHGPFRWAHYNLQEVERNKRDRITVPWRYTILRLHEAVQPCVPFLNEEDRARFDSGLARIFIDNYAAIPSQSIRRLLALREANLIRIVPLGPDYELDIQPDRTEIYAQGERLEFDVFIDARGQQPLKTRDLPFPRLRQQLQTTGEEIPTVGDDYTLQEPECVRGRIAFGAIPYLMHDHPFVQGLTACAEIGAAMAKAIAEPPKRLRGRLPFIAD